MVQCFSVDFHVQICWGYIAQSEIRQSCLSILHIKSRKQHVGNTRSPYVVALTFDVEHLPTFLRKVLATPQAFVHRVKRDNFLTAVKSETDMKHDYMTEREPGPQEEDTFDRILQDWQETAETCSLKFRKLPQWNQQIPRRYERS
ncbi:hypothetical protein AVEN_24979-1 [Araneus ventricosus]|uniref:Uncharacterized protein n=1 Tax=Araneus ventricosus TaxID=182803 RepID=A0A4Y2V5P2_ARAVE|nr:hypothetical protein AVEN_24979-1 [Araneus ventricosus]